MGDRLPSLTLLLDLSQGEREKQLAHFDALDAKAGIVLGFAGVLIALISAIGGVWKLGALIAAFMAAGSSLAAFWPRDYPVLLPNALRSYLTSEEAFTRLTVLDTLGTMIDATSELLRHKARRLRTALASLATAALLYGLGALAT